MDLWFPVTDPSGTAFDRLTMLKAALFDIFADHNRIPHVLDYVEMVTIIYKFSITQFYNFATYKNPHLF